jgi:hypothetical protein
LLHQALFSKGEFPENGLIVFLVFKQLASAPSAFWLAGLFLFVPKGRFA